MANPRGPTRGCRDSRPERRGTGRRSVLAGERQPDGPLRSVLAGNPALSHLASGPHVRQPDNRGGLDGVRSEPGLRGGRGDVGSTGRSRNLEVPAARRDRGVRPSVKERSDMSSATRKRRPDLDRHEPVRRFDGVFGRRPDAVRPDPVHTNGAGPVAARKHRRAGRGGGLPRHRGLHTARAGLREVGRLTTFFGGVAGVRSATADRAHGAVRVRPGGGLARVHANHHGPASRGSPFDDLRAHGRTPDVGGFDIGSEPARARAPASGPNGRAGTEGADHAPRPETPRISIDIRSKLRAEISVELRPGSARLPLEAHDLRSSRSGDRAHLRRRPRGGSGGQSRLDPPRN